MRTELTSVHIITICYSKLSSSDRYSLYLDVTDIVDNYADNIDEFFVYDNYLTLEYNGSIEVARRLFDNILGVIHKHNVEVLI